MIVLQLVLEQIVTMMDFMQMFLLLTLNLMPMTRMLVYQNLAMGFVMAVRLVVQGEWLFAIDHLASIIELSLI